MEVKEIRPLTGVRGIAALWVVLFRAQPYWLALFPSLGGLNILARNGGLGVDLFFILSGFILSYVYHAGRLILSRESYLKFIEMRFARIYPIHFATICVLLVLMAVAHFTGTQLSGSFPWSGLPFQLTMTHSWPYCPGGAWNSPSWSISAEWFAYLFIFPLACWLLRQRWKLYQYFVGVYICLFMWQIFEQNQIATAFHTVWRVGFEFLAGSLLYGAYRQGGGWLYALTQKHTTVIFALLIVATGLLPVSERVAQYLAVSLMPLLLMGLTAEQSLLAKACASRGMLWMGRISYSLYMSHAIVLKLQVYAFPAGRWSQTAWPVRLGVIAGSLLFLLLSAAALYYLVEVPARTHLRRLSGMRARLSAKFF